MLPFLQTAPAPTTFVIEGHRPASEATVGTAAMRYLPFDVPKGVTSIEIDPQIGDKEGDRDTVDLGLFDPRGYGPGGPGFRGWQGGTRQAVTITGDPATTSSWYIAGPLPAGRWHLAQYYLKASSKGLDYRYLIKFRFHGAKPPERFPRLTTYRPTGLPTKAGWYAGNLHAHTVHSDGALTLSELAAKNRRAGFDFLVSTEHNTWIGQPRFSEAAQAAPGLLLIAGDELTTPGGHANIYGQKPGYWFDFRTQPGDGGLPRLMREVVRQKAVFVINHPFALCTSCPWRFSPEEWKGAAGIEVWNGPWDQTDEEAVRWWDGLLRAGQRLNAYGGTDFHREPNLLTPATSVWASSLGTDAVLDGLRRGRVVITRDPKGPTVRIQASSKGRIAIPGDTLKTDGTINLKIETMDAAGMVVTVHTAQGVKAEMTIGDTPRTEETVRIQGRDPGYVRVEMRRPDSAGQGEMIAMTNAIFVE